MTAPRLDEETQVAVKALVFRLRNRDADTDDEAFADEYMAALKSRGWRPTEAKPAPTWREQTANRDHGDEPPPEYLAVKADLQRRLNRDVHEEETPHDR